MYKHITILTDGSEFSDKAIVRTAENYGCDLICMASHARRGISTLVQGSQTHGVLTHSTIPTLVYR
jgi:nucleotide-binding universal stress UspA family protein